MRCRGRARRRERRGRLGGRGADRARRAPRNAKARSRAQGAAARFGRPDRAAGAAAAARTGPSSAARLSMASLFSAIGRRELSFADKVRGINWGLVFLISAISGIGFAMLYSAANGNLQPWASKQMARFAIAFIPMIAAALIDIRHWFRLAYWIYGLALVLVLMVDLRGVIGMGAQRWIDLGVIQLQPSELMKIAMVLAVAHYFHCLNAENGGRVVDLLVPAGLIAVPAVLVLKQPDLGTAIMLLANGGILFFLAGVRRWIFGAAAAAAAAAAPLIWSLLRDYQKARLYTFLSPDADPLGAGYNTMQSKMAWGWGD